MLVEKKTFEEFPALSRQSGNFSEHSQGHRKLRIGWTPLSDVMLLSNQSGVNNGPRHKFAQPAVYAREETEPRVSSF